MSDDKSKQKNLEREDDDRPLTFKLANWWGFVLATVYLLYGGVKIILSVLDRNYDAIPTPLMFGLIGLILITVAYQFREVKKWAWIGMIAINGVVVILSAVSFNQIESLVLLIISAGALYALFAPQTKEYLAAHG